MKRLRLTFACWDYDRTRALADGRVRPGGIELNYLTQPVEETFFRMLRNREFDCAEMSLSSYVASLNAKEDPFVAIPAFPSRFFRHSCIFVSAKSGIRRAGALTGRADGCTAVSSRRRRLACALHTKNNTSPLPCARCPRGSRS